MNKAIWIVIVIAVILIIAGIYIYMPKSGSISYGNQNTPPAVPGAGNTGGNTGGSTGGTTTPQTHTINIQNFAFNPSSLPIKVGDTVIWTNMDSMGHTVTSDSGSELTSPTITTGKTFSHTFTTAGTFSYHCSIHPSMKASIIVQ